MNRAYLSALTQVELECLLIICLDSGVISTCFPRYLYAVRHAGAPLIEIVRGRSERQRMNYGTNGSGGRLRIDRAQRAHAQLAILVIFAVQVSPSTIGNKSHFYLATSVLLLSRGAIDVLSGVRYYYLHDII